MGTIHTEKNLGVPEKGWSGCETNPQRERRRNHHPSSLTLRVSKTFSDRLLGVCPSSMDFQSVPSDVWFEVV